MVGSIGIKWQWKDSHAKGNMKGKVNCFEISYASAMLGNVVFNVVHE